MILYNRSIWNVLSNDAACADQGARADSHAAQNSGAGADRSPSLHPGRNYLPVLFGLKRAVIFGGPRILVVNERDVVANEYLVLNFYTLADESVAGDLAIGANARTLLDFNKGADPGAIADGATIEVHEVTNHDVFAKHHIGRNSFQAHNLFPKLLAFT